MAYPELPDPIAAIRAMIAREQQALFDRVVPGSGPGCGVRSAAGAAAGAVRRNLFQRADDLRTLLASVPHRAANAIADLDRGAHTRALTAGEAALVRQAYGSRVNPGDVRIVDGAGWSAVAAVAFLHGNPAITVGNTIYVRHDRYRPDMTTRTDDVNTLIHDHMHVLQYKELGFARFGSRYLSELKANGGDPNRLYDYESRKLDFAHETLEGQAAIVGDYAGDRVSPKAADRQAGVRLQPRLHGTGIYGN